MIIHVVSNVIVIPLVRWNQSVIPTRVLAYVRKTFMDLDVIDVLMAPLLYCLTIRKAAPIVIVLARQLSAIPDYSIIVLFVICPIGP